MEDNRGFLKKLISFIMKFLLVILIPYLIISTILVYQRLTNDNNLPSIFGFKPYIISDSSMGKTIEKNDFVVVKEIEDYTTVKSGDILAYKISKGKYAVHRVVSILKYGTNETDNSIFRTKADNNKSNDKLNLLSEDVEGIYLFKIPKIGKYLRYTDNVWYFVLSIPILIILIMIVILIGGKFDKKRKKVEFEEPKKKVREETKILQPYKENTEADIKFVPPDEVAKDNISNQNSTLKVIPIDNKDSKE